VEYLFRNEDLYIEIDLARQTVTAGEHKTQFEIHKFHKKLLLEGLDSIGLTLQLEDYIAKYERQRQMFPLRSD
jgi:3-isopropylmalate/(R)-2-methylmalate dehydratase small subunit